ncbi:hypothetical protein BOTBODRAFT_181849 [Botryobasidium botryosum FD-172 SS1]|uniref:Uncharacterized protein n=1 Tax=Botryobasidium botryosum (strain FD-172 SS1) TaxID=930990 RepID=A0A067LSF0_BOTB1|nr:hypothetical protein BOTBODRAFT_181849 [Botryobasidium botryosum FD-172 SS1]
MSVPLPTLAIPTSFSQPTVLAAAILVATVLATTILTAPFSRPLFSRLTPFSQLALTAAQDPGLY